LAQAIMAQAVWPLFFFLFEGVYESMC